MRREKRRWIFSGLGVPEGVALVREPLGGTARLLVAGSEAAAALHRVLEPLAKEAGMPYRSECRPGTTGTDWAAGLLSELLAWEPTRVVLGLRREAPSAAELERQVAAAGAALLWVGPDEPVARGASAADCAAWAGRVLAECGPS